MSSDTHHYTVLISMNKGILSDRLYLETVSIILILLSGLVFSISTFKNNVAICFFVEFFFLTNKSSLFLSSLLATDVREKENPLSHGLPFPLVFGEMAQMEQGAVLEPALGNG